jgi:hypothetical protein
MAVTRRFGVLAFKKQAVAGTAETGIGTTGFAVPANAGVVGPGNEFGDLPRSGSSLARLGRYKQRSTIAGTVTMLCHPEALGLLLYQAMGAYTGPVIAAGVGTHTFKMADPWPFPMTVWSSIGSGSDADWYRYNDAFVSRLAINGASGENVMVDVEFVAKNWKRAVPSPGLTDADIADADPRMKFIGSDIRIDADGTSLGTPLTNVESVGLEINRDPEVRYGPSITPAVLAPDRQVNLTATVTYDSAQQGWDFLTTANTGSASGTDPDQSTPTGAADVKFGRHPADAAKYLRFVTGPSIGSPDALWHYDVARPDAEATPGLVDFDLAGIVAYPAAGPSEVTVELANDKVTAY